MKRVLLAAMVGLCLGGAVYGLPPFTGSPNSSFASPDVSFVSEIRRLPNGVFEVSALTPLPDVAPKMVEWWFADYMQTTEHYVKWYPEAHIWMDWENKEQGEILGASHLVHEYIGEELQKLRIQFVPPEDILGEIELGPDDVALCAKVGLLKTPLYVGEMCHVVLANDNGAEMRSRFWLGMTAKRSGNNTVPSLTGWAGSTYLARLVTQTEARASALMEHCLAEMTILAGFLPTLYTETK